MSRNNMDKKPEAQSTAPYLSSYSGHIRQASAPSQFVSIRAGQGPSDPPISDVFYKPPTSGYASASASAARTEELRRQQADMNHVPNDYARPTRSSNVETSASYPQATVSKASLQPPQPQYGSMPASANLTKVSSDRRSPSTSHPAIPSTPQHRATTLPPHSSTSQVSLLYHPLHCLH